MKREDTALVIRADANGQTGAGHVMRCCSLAEGWAREVGSAVHIWGSVTLPFAVERCRQVTKSIGRRRPDVGLAILVVDSYKPRVRNATSGLSFLAKVLVDDLGGSVPAGFDAVWNPNAYASPSLYPDFEGELIGGEDFIALRSDLPRWRPSSDTAAVLLGGSDIARTLMQNLERLPAVVGRSCARPGPEGAGWQRLDQSALWKGTSSCASLLTASGSTVWEAAAIGIPTGVVLLADNQEYIFNWAVHSGAPGVRILDLPPKERVSAAADLLRRARPLPRIENGARRVARALEGLSRS